MTALSYEAKMTLTPAEGKRGQPVTLEVRFENVIGQIQRVYMTVPGYGIMQNLTRKSDLVYSMTMPVPWEAPAGNYTIQVHAADSQQQRGPVIRENYTVH